MFETVVFTQLMLPVVLSRAGFSAASRIASAFFAPGSNQTVKFGGADCGKHHSRDG
jgi:hypothetical protein